MFDHIAEFSILSPCSGVLLSCSSLPDSTTDVQWPFGSEAANLRYGNVIDVATPCLIVDPLDLNIGEVHFFRTESPGSDHGMNAEQHVDGNRDPLSPPLNPDGCEVIDNAVQTSLTAQQNNRIHLMRHSTKPPPNHPIYRRHAKLRAKLFSHSVHRQKIRLRPGPTS